MSVEITSSGVGGSATWTAQTDYYIDPVNGSDAAAGTVGAPLKTRTEWLRRMQGGTINVSMTVHMLGDSISVDQPIGVVNVGRSGSIVHEGTSGMVALHSGTFTAVTALDATSNTTPWAATDSALGANDWANYISNSAGSVTRQLVIVTSGARAGNSFWPGINSGSKTAVFSQPGVWTPASGFFGQSLGSIAVADPYTVYQLPKLQAESITYNVAANGSFVEQVVYRRLGFSGDFSCVATCWTPYALGAYECDMGASMLRGGPYSYVGCRFAGAFVNQGDYAQIGGGLAVRPFEFCQGSAGIMEYRARFQSRLGVYSQGAPIIGRVQLFNTDASGDGLECWQGSSPQMMAYLGSAELFGTSTRYGVRVQQNAYPQVDNLTGKIATGGTNSVAVGSLSAAAWNASNQPVAQFTTTAGSARAAGLLIQ